MVLKSTAIGIACTVTLVALLAISRQFSYENEKVFEITEVETITLEPPPPPPETTPPEELPDEIPPPAPSLDLPSDLAAIDTPEITLSLDEVPITMAVQVFNTDTAPAKIPIKPVKKKVTQTKAPPKNKITKKAPVKKTLVKKATPAKSHYSSGELDTKPRQRYTGKYTWPRKAKGTSASVKLLIEISTSGRVKVIKIVSSSNPDLNSAAMKVASGSRFTSPLYKGKPVKARFYKTYILKK